MDKQQEQHLQATIDAIQAIAGEIQYDQRTGLSLGMLNRKSLELAIAIVSEANKEKRHADNMKLKRSAVREFDRLVTTIARRL